MKLKIFYCLIIILGFLVSCANPDSVNKTDKVIIENRMAIPGMKFQKLINELRPESQYFQINAVSDTILVGKNGTQVFIPENSFINEKGDVVTGMVGIELIEILTVADIVRTNLQTISSGRTLQSEGMLYIDAKANGQAVTMAKDKKLQIELPNMNQTGMPSDIKIFSGSYDTTGRINWTESGKPENRLIPLPLDLFDYKKCISYGFIRIQKNRGYQISNSDCIEDSITFNKKSLENTFIATREFEERFAHIISAEWAIGQYTSYYSTTVQTGQMIKDSTISNIYLRNLDKDLWYCDSLAYVYMKTWEGRAQFNSHWYSEAETFDLLNAFKNHYKQKLTTVFNFPADIDLRKKDARVKLKENGFKVAEIDELIGAFERQNRIVTARRNQVDAQITRTNSFSIAKLGWVNCDEFYNDPQATEVDIYASVRNSAPFDFACLSLVLNNRRIALNGIENDGKYRFTGDTRGYAKLPIGEKATIVGISYKDNKPYFGSKEIVISKKGSYELDLKVSSIEDISTKLNAIQ
jgi:hypothetical protein